MSNRKTPNRKAPNRGTLGRKTALPPQSGKWIKPPRAAQPIRSAHATRVIRDLQNSAAPNANPNRHGPLSARHNDEDYFKSMCEEIEMWRKRIARHDWSIEQVGKFHAAQLALLKAWGKQMEAHIATCPDVDEDGFCDCELPDPPEQAEADRLEKPIRDVIDHDRWPAHLHWTL